MTNLWSFRAVVAVVSLLSLTISTGRSEDPRKKKAGVEKGVAWYGHTLLSINNLFSWQRNDGVGNESWVWNGAGLEYPFRKGWMVFSDNLILGGEMYTGGFPGNGGVQEPFQPIRVNGGTYTTSNGMDPIWLDIAGRVLRIRRDYASASDDELAWDATNVWGYDLTGSDVTETRTEYARDWDEWPVDAGAPYIERNGIPGYQKPPAFGPSFTVDSLILGNYDEPGVAGSDPSAPADQVIFIRYSGLTNTTLTFAGSEPMGVEVQKTVWAYKRLWDCYYVRYKLLNRGSYYVDNMYVGQWVDPDVGYAYDDLVGCDSTLHMGFAYNAAAGDSWYSNFALPPPSIGYDILAGPTIPSPGDSAVVDFGIRHDLKNLSMTSFAYYLLGYDPRSGDYYNGTLTWWALLQGFQSPGVTFPSGPFPESKFPLSGDPSDPSTFIDGMGTDYSPAPYDRRMLMNTGPFRLAPGDTQEVYIGVCLGIGTDNLSSVQVMKGNNANMQKIFDERFALPVPPKPRLTATALDRQIILEWGSAVETVVRTEHPVIQTGYRFEGYNLYQLPPGSMDKSKGMRIASFDLPNGTTVIAQPTMDPLTGLMAPEVIANGTDGGVIRSIKIDRDFLSGYTPGNPFVDLVPLVNGKEYTFAVSAYNYLDTLGPLKKSYESDLGIVTVRPQMPFGSQPSAEYGDSVQVMRTAGNTKLSVAVIVVDPLACTGDTYEISFNGSGRKNEWSLYNTNRGQYVWKDQPIDQRELIADGVMVILSDPPNDFASFEVVANGAGPLDPPEQGCFAFKSNGFPLLNGSDRPTEAQQVGPAEWGIHAANTTYTEASYSFFRTRVSRSDANWSRIVPYDFEIRFTSRGGKAWMAYTSGGVADVPFELWNIGTGSPNDTSDDYRMIPWISDIDNNGVFNITRNDHDLSSGDNDPYTDWIYWREPNPSIPGTAGYDAFANDPNYDGGSGTGAEAMARMVLVNVDGGSVSNSTWPANVNQGMPETGTIFRITTGKRGGTAEDVFSFATPKPDRSADVANASLSRIVAFPNPYYAGATSEAGGSTGSVTFNNLPPKAIFRIFNLAGQLVKTLHKDSPSQFFEWDLKNENNWLVASGIYVCYIEMPELGETKTVKLAIIQTVRNGY